ncbi:Uncharacterised protein [Mycobacteroides abscessus subsp. abscessus]|nr:Uncharacterised protein [Mycobacteroides abscessus subsp. abscessus]
MGQPTIIVTLSSGSSLCLRPPREGRAGSSGAGSLAAGAPCRDPVGSEGGASGL